VVRGGSRDEKVCAWSAWETKISRNGAERALSRPIPPAHSRFLLQTKCRAQSSPEKIPPRPITPTAPLTRHCCPASDGSSRALRVNWACSARLFPSSLPCSWLRDPLHVCIGTSNTCSREFWRATVEDNRKACSRQGVECYLPRLSVLARLPFRCILSRTSQPFVTSPLLLAEKPEQMLGISSTHVENLRKRLRSRAF
jgi:hypothetical protein